MLETISKGFSLAKNILKKEATLNENNIKDALKEVKLALLEADVEYSVTQTFLNRVKEKALGLTVKTAVKDKKNKVHKISPAEHFIKICHEELSSLMGPLSEDLTFKKPFSVIMMVGLQGSGKTTSSAKLAKYLKEEKNLKPLLVAADIYRPGAATQLKILGERIGVDVFHLEHESPQKICEQGLIQAQKNSNDVVIFDTAGRLAIDEKLMNELKDIKALSSPEHILLVVDSMIGQDAVNTAKTFNENLELSGFILTKLDGDSRGGAAISIKEVTKKPIKFLSFGEDLKSFELFRPEGLAGRILGMGDIVSLAKDFEKHVSEKEAEEDVEKILKGSFSFEDFLKQLNMVRKIGSFKSILERIPGIQDMMPKALDIDEREFTKFESMILSMTLKERKFPQLLIKEKSRISRVAKGSGRKVEEVNELVKRFITMRDMMGNMKGLLSSKGPGSLPTLPKGMPNLMGNNFGSAFSPKELIKNKVSTKQKKDKRKLQKDSRKKNKKRK